MRSVTTVDRSFSSRRNRSRALASASASTARESSARATTCLPFYAQRRPLQFKPPRSLACPSPHGNRT
jgi:hypothetical protein